MKVLYLIYSKFNSFDEFVIKNRTGFPWVDSLINEVIKRDKVSIGLAVPINLVRFRRRYKTVLSFMVSRIIIEGIEFVIINAG